MYSPSLKTSHWLVVLVRTSLCNRKTWSKLFQKEWVYFGLLFQRFQSWWGAGQNKAAHTILTVKQRGGGTDTQTFVLVGFLCSPLILPKLITQVPHRHIRGELTNLWVCLELMRLIGKSTITIGTTGYGKGKNSLMIIKGVTAMKFAIFESWNLTFYGTFLDYRSPPPPHSWLQ